MPLLWVDANVVFRGLDLDDEESGYKQECTKEKVSQYRRVLKETREHRKIPWEPRGQSGVCALRPPGQSHDLVFPFCVSRSHDSLLFNLHSASYFLPHKSSRSSKK